MKIELINFSNNNKIKKEYICTAQQGKNVSPHIKWNKIAGAKSYALIIEDPDAVIGTFIHWYIPYINKDICEIDNLNNLINHNSGIVNNINYNKLNDKIKDNKIKIFQAQNSIDEFGYHGPCAPINTGLHRYIFRLYALDNIINLNSDIIKIKNSADFLKKISKISPKINIIDQGEIQIMYEYMQYSNKN
jgi:Raf kinase inhibitor-like YbhB/YbcL family protein